MNKIGELKFLAEKARKELRDPGRGQELPHTEAFAKFFNGLSQTPGFGSPNSFPHEFWGGIAQKMGERSKMEQDPLFWVAGVAGRISLLPISTPETEGYEDLKRYGLLLLDAIDLAESVAVVA